MTPKTELGGLLIARGLISRSQLDAALARQRGMGGRLGTCLLETGSITEDALLAVLSEQLGVPVATRSDLEAVPQELISLLSPDSAINCCAIPFRGSSHRVDVALVDAGDLTLEDELSFSIGKSIRPHLATELRVLEALHKYYGGALPLRFRQLLDRKGRTEASPRASEAEPEFSPIPAYLRPGSESAGPRSLSPNPAPPQFERQTIQLTPEEREALEASREQASPAENGYSRLGQLLSQAETASHIGAALIERLSDDFRNVLLFRVTSGREEVSGWMGSGADVDLEWLRHYSVGLYQATVFRDLNEGAPAAEGPLATTAGHHALARCWGGRIEAPSLFQPVTVRGRMVCAIYVNRGVEEITPADAEFLRKVGKMAELAFERCILRRKLQTH